MNHGYVSDLDAAARVIEEARSVVATGHINPDGDALGSALGLALACRSAGAGREARVCFGGGFALPHQFEFLDTTPLTTPDKVVAPDVLVAFDTNDPARLGEEMADLLQDATTVVMIDHHDTGPGFGDVRVSDPSAPAAALICYRLIRRLGWGISSDVANALLLGLVTDTGRFQYSNTTPEALRGAADLVEAGARPEVIGQWVYESAAFGYLGVAGAVLSRAQLDPSRSLVWSYLTQDDLRCNGVGIEDADALIDSVRLAREAEVALLLKEQPDGKWKLSLRSRKSVNVAEVAAALGGGGHHRASGCTFEGAMADALEAVRKRLPA